MKIADINEVLAFALAYAALDLVKLPGRFVNVLERMLKYQQENPNEGVVTAQTAEQTDAGMKEFNDFKNNQLEYEKNSQASRKWQIL